MVTGGRIRGRAERGERHRLEEPSFLGALLDDQDELGDCYGDWLDGRDSAHERIADDPDAALRHMLAARAIDRVSAETRRSLAERVASLEGIAEAPRAVVRMVGYRVRSAPAYAGRLHRLHAEGRLRWISGSRVGECVVGVPLDGFGTADAASVRIDRSVDEAACRVAGSLYGFLRDMPADSVGELGEHVVESFDAPEAGAAKTEWTVLAVHGVTVPEEALLAVGAFVEDARFRGVALHLGFDGRASLHVSPRLGGFTFGAACAVEGASTAADVATALARSEEGYGDALALMHPDLRAIVEAAGRPEGCLVLRESIAEPKRLAANTRKLEGRTNG